MLPARHVANASSALADLFGKVISVIDGDTIEVLHEQEREHIRLNGIDCPEKGQAFGKNAKTPHPNWLLEKMYSSYIWQEKHGRTIADVLLVDGTNLNQTLVQAPVVSEVRAENLALEQAEHAKEAKRGVMNDSDPVPPWCTVCYVKEHLHNPFQK